MFFCCKEILGIYLDSSSLESCHLKRESNKWILVDETWTTPDRKKPVSEQLQATLRSLRPSKKRKICLALPRNSIFVREIKFSNLEPEEAANSVHLGISMHAHLKPDEIYHDQWAYKKGSETIVLLVYAERKLLDPIFKVFRETGHIKSLKTVAPATLGFDILLRKFGNSQFPCLSLGAQGPKMVLALHGKEFWEGSHILPLSEGQNLDESLKRLSGFLPEPFSNYDSLPIFSAGNSVWAPNPSLKNPCDTLEGLSHLCDKTQKVSWGLCAAGLGLSPYPVISLGLGKRRKPLHMRINAPQIAAGALASVLIGITLMLGYKVQSTASQLEQLEKKAIKLEQQLAPLISTQKEIEKLEKEYQDIMAFSKELVPPLDIMKALAELTPTDTWIRNFNYKSNRLKLTVEGGSAVSVIAGWRKNPLFQDVKLVSPVTKVAGKERYSVEIMISPGKGGGNGH